MAFAKDKLMRAGFNRRALLRAMPAALAVGAVPAFAAVAVQETPVMMLFREWEAAVTEESSLDAALPIGGSEDALVDEAWEKRRAIEYRMMIEKCQSPQDALAKIAAWTFYGDFMFDNSDERLAPVWAEIRALVA